jgi:hypothetical protein
VISISSKLKKFGFALLLSTLTIGFAASISIESPSQDAVQDGITINASNDADSSWINFEIDGPNDDKSNETEVESKDYVTYDFTAGNNNYGEYTITVEDNESNTDSKDVTIDGEAPSVSFPDDLDYVGSNPSVNVDIDDSHSGVNSVDASASGDAEVDNVDDGICDGSSSCEVTIDVDTGDMDEGDEFDLEVTPEDEVGNSDTDSIDGIVLDTGYDGDESADVQWSESGSNILDGFSNEDQDVTVSMEGDSVTDTTVSCLIDGSEVSSDTMDASGEEKDFECSIESDEYASSSFELTVEAEDEAGNSETIVEDKEMYWDTSAPSISELENPEGVSTFNDGFDLSFSASDDSSGFQTLEYYFDASTSIGEGNKVSLDEPGSDSIDREISIKPNGIGQDNHTVYVRVEDNTGKTQVESFDFEYYPDREPKVNLKASESIEVTSGQTTSLTLTVRNDSPFFLSSVEVSGESSSLWNGSISASGLEEGDSVDKTIEVDSTSVEVGKHNLKLVADTGDSTNVKVIVRATEEQKTSIEDSLEDWENKSSSLKENVSSISTLEESNENISGFTSKVSSIRDSVENGNYYQAKAKLENIQEDFEKAESTYSKAKKQHKSKMRTRLFIAALFGVLLIGGGSAAGLLAYRNEEFDVEELSMPDGLPELGVMDRISELVEEAEEKEEEYSFEGFN